MNTDRSEHALSFIERRYGSDLRRRYEARVVSWVIAIVSIAAIASTAAVYALGPHILDPHFISALTYVSVVVMVAFAFALFALAKGNLETAKLTSAMVATGGMGCLVLADGGLAGTDAANVLPVVAIMIVSLYPGRKGILSIVGLVLVLAFLNINADGISFSVPEFANMPPTAIKWWFAFLIVMMAVTAFATAAENENTQLRRSLEHERARLANLASRDDLTGLRNGRWLRNQLHSLADSGEEVRCALFYIDLDGFKQINDTYGHGAGDAVLCHVSDKLTERCGGEFLPARVGGDEFIIFAEHAMNRIEREAFSDTLQSALLEPFEVDELRLTIGASIGHACIPDDAENPRQLIAIADQAMYAAKLRRRAGEMAREISGQSEEEADQGMKKAG